MEDSSRGFIYCDNAEIKERENDPGAFIVSKQVIPIKDGLVTKSHELTASCADLSTGESWSGAAMHHRLMACQGDSSCWFFYRRIGRLWAS